MLDFRRDYLIDFFGFKTLERAYLMKVNKTIVERPQHLWMSHINVAAYKVWFHELCLLQVLPSPTLGLWSCAVLSVDAFVVNVVVTASMRALQPSWDSVIAEPSKTMMERFRVGGLCHTLTRRYPSNLSPTVARVPSSFRFRGAENHSQL